MKVKNIFIILLLFFVSSIVIAKRKVIFKYKSKEVIDLGNLEIKGSVIAPGDISIKQRRRKKFDQNLLEMPDFDRECKEDIENLR